MPNFRQISSQTVENKNVNQEQTVLTKKQQKMQDALDFAELIYDIFQDDLSSVTMDEKHGKDNQND